jgi:hypothetical protein
MGILRSELPEVEAIEVYPGATVLPPGIGGNAMAPFGAILIWTRR